MLESNARALEELKSQLEDLRQENVRLRRRLEIVEDFVEQAQRYLLASHATSAETLLKSGILGQWRDWSDDKAEDFLRRAPVAKDRDRVGLLDSSVAVELLRGNPQAIDWLEQAQPSTLALPDVVALELMDGARNKRELREVLRFLHLFPLIWPNHTDCARALRAFRDHCLSSALSVPDVLIGETAVGLEAVLYALDGDFEVIEGLDVERPW